MWKNDPSWRIGEEVVGREQHDHEASDEVDRPRPELEETHGDARRRAAVGDDIHDGDGVELHDEHAHGDAAELLGPLVHLALPQPVGPVDLEGREPLQVLEEGVAERRVARPVPGEQALRPGLDGGDGDGDERHADEQHRRGEGAHRREHREEREGRKQGVEELREVGAEVGLELVDALDGDLHDLRGERVLAVRGAEPQELLVDDGAQPPLHRAG